MQLDRSTITAVKPIADFLQKLPHDTFVLHGSPQRLTVVEPRQAAGNPKWPHLCMYAVYASISVEFALIHALIEKPSYVLDEKEECIMVRGEKIVVNSGYIYVLPIHPFTPIDDGVGGMCLTAKEPVEALAVVEVVPEMLAHYPLIGFQCIDLIKGA